MRKHLGRVLCTAVFIIVSLVLSHLNLAFAIPPLSEGNARQVIEGGMNKKYLVYAPVGEIKMDYFKPENKWFTAKMIDKFKVLQKIGLINMTPVKIATEIFPRYNVSLTEKGKKLTVGTDESGFYLFRIGDMKISKIIKNTEYKDPAKPSEEFRLLLCVFDYFPTEIGKEWYAANGEKLHKQYKLKALLRSDPFQDKYLLIESDWGYLDREKYETNNIK